MTDAFLAELRKLFANAQAAGVRDPRLVFFGSGEVGVYLQADAETPGETWCTETSWLPTAAAWRPVLDQISDGAQLSKLLDDVPVADQPGGIGE